MPRYATKGFGRVGPEIEWYDEYEEPLMTDISVDETVAVETGILDPSGEMIWRLPNGVGFGADVD